MSVTSCVPRPACLTVVDLLGHARPVTNFCARVVKLRPHVTITFLTTDAFCDRIKKELARSFDDGDEHLAQRVRCGFARAVLEIRTDTRR